MSESSEVSITAVVLATAQHCVEMEARGDVGSLLELTRTFEDLVVATHVGQARSLSRLTVRESADFSPSSTVQPGPEAVTPQEIAKVLEMSVESVRSRLAVADTLAEMPALAAAAEAEQLRWWQLRRGVEAAWRLTAATRAALDTHLARLAADGRLRNGSAVTDAIRAALAPQTRTGMRPPRPRQPGRHRRRSARIGVTVSAETLLGVREHAGQLQGWGPITPAHARRLAVTEGATWQRILTDPISGSVLDIGRTRYTPTAAITDHVLTRDGGRCRRPGCFHLARDLDNAHSWEQGGTTAVDNLQASVAVATRPSTHGVPVTRSR